MVSERLCKKRPITTLCAIRSINRSRIQRNNRRKIWSELKLKRFSDFAKPSSVMTGDKIRISDILGKEIEVIGYKITDSKQKLGTEMLTLQFKIEGEERILFTGSNVLIDQIKEY